MAFKRSRQYFEQLPPPNMQLRLAGSPTHRSRGRRRLEEDGRRGARPRDECPRIARVLGAGVGTNGAAADRRGRVGDDGAWREGVPDGGRRDVRRGSESFEWKCRNQVWQ